MRTHSSTTIPRAAFAVALLSAAILGAGGMGPGDATAGPASWVQGDEAEFALLSAETAVAPGAGTASLALAVRIAEGWHIYWRTPGAAGLPPQLDWAGSDNLADVTMQWPAPMRFESFGQQSYGYRDEVLFPVTATLARPGEALAARLSVAYLICREVCIPGEATLSLDLPAGAPAPTAEAALIALSHTRLPGDAASRGLALSARSEPRGLSVIVRGAAPFAAPDLFLEWPLAPGQRRPDLPRPVVTLADGGREAHFAITVHPPLVRPGTVLRVTVTDGDRAAEGSVTIAPAVP
ncbi:protein-disulfide reductase DsbD domain-containing protein [Elioraea sp.]|uniref:protein-disulfide reductase DsbD domain-containing protein n=1 Tax=Elioraea sp. TaxID=2185103 RepID=UPI0025BE1D7D|nr:protein-disulfide reductase DsbD domain-containing protein [Elioraea sp.]